MVVVIDITIRVPDSNISNYQVGFFWVLTFKGKIKLWLALTYMIDILVETSRLIFVESATTISWEY